MFWKTTCVTALAVGVFMTASAYRAGMEGLDLWIAGGLTVVLVLIVARALRGGSRT